MAPSADGSRSSDAGAEAGHHGSPTREALAQEFGISASNLDGVSTILNEGTRGQIEELRALVFGLCMRRFNKTNSKKTSNLQTAVRKKSDETILNSSTKISE